MIRLEPMDDVAFEEFLTRAISRRASKWVERGIWSAERAPDACREEYRQLLPGGRRTPGHHFCTVASEDGSRVGETWYTAQTKGGKMQFWVEWIAIDPEHQRHGLASATLGLLEEEARRRGADRIGLNVWADNAPAVALYRKLGYTVSSCSMAKSTT